MKVKTKRTKRQKNSTIGKWELNSATCVGIRNKGTRTVSLSIKNKAGRGKNESRKESNTEHNEPWHPPAYERNSFHSTPPLPKEMDISLSSNPSSQSYYKITQLLFFLPPLLLLRRAARVAYWKTSRTPSPVLAEHSRYCLAPIFVATAIP